MFKFLHKQNKFSPEFIGFMQATGLVLYISLVASFFNFANAGFPKVGTFFAPLMMLLLLCISVATCGTLIFGKAAVLFWEKKYKDAFTLVGITLGWALGYLATFILIAFTFYR